MISGLGQLFVSRATSGSAALLVYRYISHQARLRFGNACNRMHSAASIICQYIRRLHANHRIGVVTQQAGRDWVYELACSSVARVNQSLNR
jgi:hypothetical protein